jgi:hypothetical protein
MEKYEFALESFKNIQDLMKFTDQKSGAVLLVSGFILTIFLEFSKELIFVEYISFYGCMTLIFGVITISLITYVIYLSIFKVVIPRLAKNYSDDEFLLFYFEHLATMGKLKIKENFQNLDKEKILEHVLDQTFEVSKILEIKTVELKNSMKYLFFSILSLLAFVLASNLI